MDAMLWPCSRRISMRSATKQAVSGIISATDVGQRYLWATMSLLPPQNGSLAHCISRIQLATQATASDAPVQQRSPMQEQRFSSSNVLVAGGRTQCASATWLIRPLSSKRQPKCLPHNQHHPQLNIQPYPRLHSQHSTLSQIVLTSQSIYTQQTSTDAIVSREIK